jgi:hypothetical protein
MIFFYNYIGTELVLARFPISFWHFGNNFNIDIPRTNNAIEGWHSVFNSTFGTSNFSFHLLVEKMKFEEDAIRIENIRTENGEVLLRNEKYIRMEERTQRYFLENSVYNFGSTFIFGLIPLLSYE